MAYDGGALSAPIATQHTRFPFFVEKSCGILWERFIPTLVGRDKSYARTGKKCLFYGNFPGTAHVTTRE
jgi:hypothetical protein